MRSSVNALFKRIIKVCENDGVFIFSSNVAVGILIRPVDHLYKKIGLLGTNYDGSRNMGHDNL
jgi:hypothetical protein